MHSHRKSLSDSRLIHAIYVELQVCISIFTIPHDSTVTLALGFVTFTPSAFALAMMSILFLDDTACDILSDKIVSMSTHGRVLILDFDKGMAYVRRYVLCCKSLIVHE